MSVLNDEIERTLGDLGLSNVKFTFDADEAAGLMNLPGTKLTFADALRSAVKAFLRDERGTGGGDSPAGVVKDAPEFHQLPKTASADDIASKLREYLTTDPAAEIALLTGSVVEKPNYRFEPEMGENIGELLVFRIILPNTLGFLIWSIVDPTGSRSAYCYTYI